MARLVEIATLRAGSNLRGGMPPLVCGVAATLDMAAGMCYIRCTGRGQHPPYMLGQRATTAATAIGSLTTDAHAQRCGNHPSLLGGIP